MATANQLSRALGAILSLAEARAATMTVQSIRMLPQLAPAALKATAAVAFAVAVLDGEPDADIERLYKAYQDAAWAITRAETEEVPIPHGETLQ